MIFIPQFGKKKEEEISEDEKLALIDKNETDMWFYNLAKNKYQMSDFYI